MRQQPPPADGARWGDLPVRIASAVVMAAIGALAVGLGGLWFRALAIVVAATVVWEVWTMISPDRRRDGLLLGVLAAGLMAAGLALGAPWGLALLLVVPVAGALRLGRHRAAFAGFALGVQAAGWGLVQMRADLGLAFVLWLVLVVIASDVFGYFGGRLMGGPKFWPRISPKKTWSGTVAGWVAAGLVGAAFMALTDAGAWIIALSMLTSLAGQMGDIVESALKRRMKVKDSSNLIPGHGGFYDRFDALLGAALFIVLIMLVVDIPRVAF